MPPLWTKLRAVPDTSVEDFLSACHAAETLALPTAARERLTYLCESFRDWIVFADAVPADTGELDLSFGLKFPPADMVFLSALRAGDIGAIRHFEGPSVGFSTNPTVGAGGIGVTADPAEAEGN